MPDVFIDGTLGFLLNKGTQALHRQLNRNFVAKGYDITNEQWSILIFLYHCDGSSQNEIAEKTLKDKVSVTKIVDNLVKNGMVLREQDKHDRRINRIFLTDDGKDLVPKLRNIALNTIESGFDNIDKNEIAVFKKVLSEIVKNLTGEDLLTFIEKNKSRWK
jgi:DNA-binding MarR family transcriptional regulator